MSSVSDIRALEASTTARQLSRAFQAWPRGLPRGSQRGSRASLDVPRRPQRAPGRPRIKSGTPLFRTSKHSPFLHFE
eukprot:333709-Pyramimonas_sp.AAC.1